MGNDSYRELSNVTFRREGYDWGICSYLGPPNVTFGSGGRGGCICSYCEPPIVTFGCGKRGGGNCSYWGLFSVASLMALSGVLPKDVIGAGILYCPKLS